ncbi:hypothetical protein RUM44_003657 [Polyplax serrata]|uniref:Uncharacterized protein n=1 Tax=Polyplax serrata TaxID=468196 RepID=A0ABR1AH41_POLSC
MSDGWVKLRRLPDDEEEEEEVKKNVVKVRPQINKAENHLEALFVQSGTNGISVISISRYLPFMWSPNDN